MNYKLRKCNLTQQQLMNIVDKILPKHLRMPEIQAETYYMLLELNIEFEGEK